MKSDLFVILLSLTMAATFCPASAQNASQTVVKVSTDKVRGKDGNIYYSHIVLEKQTLFSISKAYGVSVEDIDKANPTLNLLREGLKKGQVLLIPITSSPASSPSNTQEPSQDDATEAQPQAEASNDFTVHIVKWFESIEDIANKYDCPTEVIAQVNNLKDGKLKKRMKLLIPKNPSAFSVEGKNGGANVPVPTQQEGEDEVLVEASDVPLEDKEIKLKEFDPALIREKKNLETLLLLPFNAKGESETSFMDFYSGAMMAVKDLKEESGINTELHVFDVAGGADASSHWITKSDIVIGPVSPSDIAKTLDNCPGSTTLVSPLDNRVETMIAEHGNLIQAPAPVSAQYRDMLEWLKSDMNASDRFVVFKEKGVMLNESMNVLSSEVERSGLEYSTINYGILEGRELFGTMQNQFASDTASVTRVIVLSENEAFVNDVVRNLNLMVYNNFKVVLYAPARLRSFNTISVENFHNVSMHASCSYYIDYDNDKVQKFVMQYRALFGAEPTQFSFQGYDIVNYFLTLASKYADQWPVALDQMEMRGMQSDFSFSDSRINQAVRRVVYNSDFSINLL